MKVNFNQVLYDLDGVELFENPTAVMVDRFLEAAIQAKIEIEVPLADFAKKHFEGKKKTLTLRSVSMDSLGATSREEQKMPPQSDVKFKRFKIALKISDTTMANGVIDLTSDEIVIIKDRIADIYPTTVMGRAWEMLEKGVIEGLTVLHNEPGTGRPLVEPGIRPHSEDEGSNTHGELNSQDEDLKTDPEL